MIAHRYTDFNAHFGNRRMKGEPVNEERQLAQSAAPTRCPLTAAMDAIGGKWSMICLYWLKLNPRRFNELRRLMPEISHKVLAATLRNLEKEGLITRAAGTGTLPHAQYQVSSYGESAAPLIEAVREWGHGHIAWRNRRAKAGAGTPHSPV